MKLTEQQGYILLGASPALALGLGIGLATGLFIAQKKLENKYNEISNREIAEAKQFYSILHKKDDFETPEAAIETLGLTTAAEALVSYQGEVLDTEDGGNTLWTADDDIRESDNAPKEPIGRVQVEETSDGIRVIGKLDGLIEHNIFTDAQANIDDVEYDEDFDYEEELKHRGEVEPYVISHDEFMEGELDNAQVSLTYYEGDDVLIDEKDQPIPDVDETVGEENLQRFGYGSKDPKVVYIRNPRLDLDFEISLSQGNYTEEVLGFIQHSDNRTKIRRFRGDDE